MIICDECETVAHCTKHGCIPKQPLGCVNHDCAKCKATPAPVQDDLPDFIAGAFGVSRGTAYDLMREALKDAAPLQEKNT